MPTLANNTPASPAQTQLMALDSKQDKIQASQTTSQVVITSQHAPKKPIPLPIAILLTLAVVIFIREGAVFVCQAFGYASAANIVGLISFFIILMLWRFTLGLPEWLTQASNTLLVDSGFAFLPVSAGAGLLIFALGDELWGIVITLVVSTILPLWALAKLADYWLGDPSNLDLYTESDCTSSHSQAAPADSHHKEGGRL